ncbi:uncharacterized protein EAE97_006530 [Botrytis byssoidea]|uniref:Uncharacterized protein n=2 Tax=Sclerotiniaceae TaxID=28983 RepID=A0A4Z1HGG6_9HELO|nr:uncharacterized protein EAE97_006530 [Botrytis byssoidea]KAF7941693.1 hypothetical protein EAE97_006530 [Botrytis byssoidea]TGO44137.1 hypothetical protein BOTNAR_0929g00040 [Botryotinia narcissicola]
MSFGQELGKLLENWFFIDIIHRMLAIFNDNGEKKKLRADLEEAQKKIIKLKEKNSALKARLTQLENRVADQFL